MPNKIIVRDGYPQQHGSITQIFIVGKFGIDGIKVSIQTLGGDGRNDSQHLVKYWPVSYVPGQDSIALECRIWPRSNKYARTFHDHPDSTNPTSPRRTRALRFHPRIPHSLDPCILWMRCHQRCNSLLCNSEELQFQVFNSDAIPINCDLSAINIK